MAPPKLSKQNFDCAAEYIRQHAPDFELAWFRFLFGEVGWEEAVEVLSRRQHKSGGFGGLMYEYAYQGPNLNSTKHAIRFLFDYQPPASHPLVQRTMAYVLDQYGPQTEYWYQLLVPEVNEELHVWWMTYEPSRPMGGSYEERFRAYNPNGPAEIAAFICQYRELVPDDLYRDIIRYPVDCIRRVYNPASPDYSEEATRDPYGMKFLLRFCSLLPDKALADELFGILDASVLKAMVLDEDKWDREYCEMPYHVVPYPHWPVYPTVEPHILRCADFLLRTQREDGSWQPCYQFGPEEAFRPYEKAHGIHMTIDNLALLKRLDRISLD